MNADASQMSQIYLRNTKIEEIRAHLRFIPVICVE